MTARTLAMAGWIGVAFSGALLAQQPQFRATTTMVSVDVSVRRGNVPVPDLTTADFQLTDNGVTQQVEGISISAVPIDIALVIDVSGSTSDQLEHYRRDVAAIAAVLRPIDQLRIIGIGSDVVEILPLTPAGAPPPVARIETLHFSAVYDGISAALLRTTGVGRRHLIVAFTDGVENRSILTGEEVVSIAERTEAVLHVVAAPIGLIGTVTLPIVPEFGDKAPQKVFTTTRGSDGGMVAGSAQPPGKSRLTKAVEATGGEVHGSSSMVEDFEKIFRDFTSSYVLSFRPAGVKATGWHALVVKVTREGSYNIQARRGYFADSK